MSRAMEARRRVHDIYGKHNPTLYFNVKPWRPVYKCSCGMVYHKERVPFTPPGEYMMTTISRVEVARMLRLAMSSHIPAPRRLDMAAWRKAQTSR